MKDSIKITGKTMMVNFEFPIKVGEVKLKAIGQAFIYKDKTSGKLKGDFEFMDQEDVSYMGMLIDGYVAWGRLVANFKEFGVDLNQLVSNEFNKVVDNDFKNEFIFNFNIKDF